MEGQRSLELILARNLLSSISTPAFLVDADGVLVFYNEAAGGLLGRRFEEAGKMSAEEWGAAFGPFDNHGQPIPFDRLPLTIALREGRPAHASHCIHSQTGEQHGPVGVLHAELADDQCGHPRHVRRSHRGSLEVAVDDRRLHRIRRRLFHAPRAWDVRRPRREHTPVRGFGRDAEDPIAARRRQLRHTDPEVRVVRLQVAVGLAVAAGLPVVADAADADDARHLDGDDHAVVADRTSLLRSGREVGTREVLRRVRGVLALVPFGGHNSDPVLLGEEDGS